MPRQRDVVMNPSKHSSKQLHDAAIKRTQKLYTAYEVVDAQLVGGEIWDWAVVYTAPLGGDRYIAGTRTKKANAIKLRDMLNQAWAEGYWSSGRE